MGNIIYLAGIQLSLVLIVVFQSGQSKSLPLLFGPFRTESDLEKWKGSFLDIFPQYCLQLPGIDNCLKSIENHENFEADNRTVIEPISPLLLAEELLGFYFEDSTYLEEGNSLPLRYYEWAVTFQFDFPNQESFTVEKTYSPINDITAFKAWRRRFKKEIRQRTQQLRETRFRVLNEKFIYLGDFWEDTAEDDFFEITCWDPEMMAQELLTDTLRDWMQKKSKLQTLAKTAFTNSQK